VTISPRRPGYPSAPLIVRKNPRTQEPGRRGDNGARRVNVIGAALPRRGGHSARSDFGRMSEKPINPHSPDWLNLSDEALLANCKFEAFRGAGPGGQKRNKTSNSIRLTHLPTGIHVVAGESRSQLENKQRALRVIDPRFFEPPDWMRQVRQSGRLASSRRNAHYERLASLVLDLLEAQRGSIADVAKLIGVSTSSVVKFLEEEPQLWSAANSIRHAAGLGPMDHRL
jgi:hypothetical protein